MSTGTVVVLRGVDGSVWECSMYRADETETGQDVCV